MVKTGDDNETPVAIVIAWARNGRKQQSSRF